MHSTVAIDTTAAEPSAAVQEPFKPYKVWVELEEVNAQGDMEARIDLPGSEVAEFADLQEAMDFAIALQRYATTGRCDALSVAAEKIFELHEARSAMHDLLRDLATALQTGLHHSRRSLQAAWVKHNRVLKANEMRAHEQLQEALQSRLGTQHKVMSAREEIVPNVKEPCPKCGGLNVKDTSSFLVCSWECPDCGAMDAEGGVA